MLELLSNTNILLLNSFIFGLFTKTADLLNEHGLKMFKGAKILYGILWGITGTFVIMGHPLLASFYLGILVNWIIKGNIDYFNHRLAAALIFTVVLYTNLSLVIDWILFGITILLFTVLGLILRKGWLKKTFFTNNNLHVFAVLIIMSLISQEYWIVVFSYLLNSIAYHALKQWGIRNLPYY